MLCLWIYTTRDRQEFCVHECTWAMDPRVGNANTRVVVFQVADEELCLFPGQVFFRNTEKDFFPILNHARIMPDGGFEFDIYMYRLPGELPYVAQGFE